MENDAHTEIETKLKSAYNVLEQENDEFLRDKKSKDYWCVLNKDSKKPIKPTIPFVGKKYAEVVNSHGSEGLPKILMYASAENLSEYDLGEPDEFRSNIKQDESISWNRHRISYVKIGGEFFPYVHIQPVTDGGLMCAALLVNYMMTREWYSDNPKVFLETLAVANAGKFSRAGSNKDYAGSLKYMKPSLAFIEEDLKLLNPDVVIIPRTIYRTICKNEPVKKLLDVRKVVPIYQISHWNMKHLEEYKKCAEKLKEKIGNSVLGEWTEKIAHRRIDFYCFYAHIIESLKKTGIDTSELCD
jgi:hypothetical protein